MKPVGAAIEAVLYSKYSKAAPAYIGEGRGVVHIYAAVYISAESQMGEEGEKLSVFRLHGTGALGVADGGDVVSYLVICHRAQIVPKPVAAGCLDL